MCPEPSRLYSTTTLHILMIYFVYAVSLCSPALFLSVVAGFCVAIIQSEDTNMSIKLQFELIDVRVLDFIWLRSASDKSFQLFLLEKKKIQRFVPEPNLWMYYRGLWPSLLCMLFTVITHSHWEPRRLFSDNLLCNRFVVKLLQRPSERSM